MNDDRVRRRAERLAAVLLDDGLASGDRVDILCCAEHEIDRWVALAACRLAAVEAVLIDADLWVTDLADLVRWSGARLTLACAHGSASWLAAGCVGRILGDGPLLPWWAAAEARGAALVPHTHGPPGVPTGTIGVVRRAGATWALDPLTSAAGA